MRPEKAGRIQYGPFDVSSGMGRFCRDRGLLEYKYSKSSGFHASKDLAKIGQKIPWGRQGEQRSSMLWNVAKGYVWQFGVS